MDFFDKPGKMAVGSRLRRLSESLTQQAVQVYDLYQVDLQPKWFPVFFLLAQGEGKTITEIAEEIGHSHPSVSTIVKEMVKKGYAREEKIAGDGRKNFIVLTEKGIEANAGLKIQCTDVNAAVERLLGETQYNLWKAIEEWEYHLGEKNLLNRVKDERKLREAAQVEIVDYTPQYQQAFRNLNVQWITEYFKMEEEDYHALDRPDEYILSKGGYILIALYQGKPVGTCALIKMDGGMYELAKMAVAPEGKGKGIGYQLGLAIIEKAKELGATKLHLGSNTILKPAISLYHKLGFKKVTGIPSPYERCNIQMELSL